MIHGTPAEHGATAADDRQVRGIACPRVRPPTPQAGIGIADVLSFLLQLHQSAGRIPGQTLGFAPPLSCSGKPSRRAWNWGSRSRTPQRGTSWAIGLPRRVITTVWPASTAIRAVVVDHQNGHFSGGSGWSHRTGAGPHKPWRTGRICPGGIAATNRPASVPHRDQGVGVEQGTRETPPTPLRPPVRRDRRHGAPNRGAARGHGP